MSARIHLAIVATAIATAAVFASANVTAQDSFNAQPQSQQRPQQQRPTQAPPPTSDGSYGNAPPRQQYPRDNQPGGLGDDGTGGIGQNQQRDPTGAEDTDFGVAPQAQLRDSNNLHAPTPTTIPGGKVIRTQQLSQLLGNAKAKALVFQVHGSPYTLPNAIAAGPASQGGSFNDDTQRGFGEFLQRSVGGDMARPLVFYCASNYCWMSYNAALRAINLGYRNVIWYRGGLNAWTEAGLQTQPAS